MFVFRLAADATSDAKMAKSKMSKESYSTTKLERQKEQSITSRLRVYSTYALPGKQVSIHTSIHAACRCGDDAESNVLRKKC
jgi:hypothetical protein